jgi:Uma2 family endonuclease
VAFDVAYPGVPTMKLLEDPHLLTVREYATLTTEGRTELIEGVVYDVSPRNSPHRNAVNVLGNVLARRLGDRYMIQQQDAVAISGWEGKNAPEPDIAVIDLGYIERMPTAEQTHAIVEVSDTTYRRDRRKVALYVSAGIPSFIVNIEKRRVERYETSADLAKKNGRVYALGETFDVLGVSIAVADLFEPVRS